MSNVTNLEAETRDERAWRMLTDRVWAIRSDIDACKLDMARIGRGFPYKTFPEAHMTEIAAELDKLALAAREMVENAARCRAELAA